MKSGVALAVAGTLKLFPGIIFLFLLMARRFRAFAAASATYLAIAAFMTARYGAAAWRLFLGQQGGVADEWMGNVRNASLHGIVVRLLSPVCNSVPRPSRTSGCIVVAASAVLLVLASAWSLDAFRRSRKLDARAIDLPFALFTVLAVFLNPWVWEHYWVLLIQPAFVLAKSSYSSFRAVLDSWMAEENSTSQFVRGSAAFLRDVAGIALVVKLLGMQEVRAERLLEFWNRTRMPWAHWQLHLYEGPRSSDHQQGGVRPARV